jgi:hypothetical protein
MVNGYGRANMDGQHYGDQCYWKLTLWMADVMEGPMLWMANVWMVEVHEWPKFWMASTYGNADRNGQLVWGGYYK